MATKDKKFDFHQIAHSIITELQDIYEREINMVYESDSEGRIKMIFSAHCVEFTKEYHNNNCLIIEKVINEYRDKDSNFSAIYGGFEIMNTASYQLIPLHNKTFTTLEISKKFNIEERLIVDFIRQTINIKPHWFNKRIFLNFNNMYVVTQKALMYILKKLVYKNDDIIINFIDLLLQEKIFNK